MAITYPNPIKFANTFTLKHLSGSPTQREQLADGLHTQFSEIVKQKLEQNGKITQDEINNALKKIAPNVDFKINPHQNNANYGGDVNYKLSTEGVLTSYDINLGFSDSNSIKETDYFAINTLFHETTHLIKSITEPKYSTHVVNTKTDTKRTKQQLEFYNNTIYNCDLLNYASSSNIKLFLAQKSSTVRKILINQSINNFFKTNGFTPIEKIETLRTWRRRLKNEQIAYEKGNNQSLEALKILQRKFEQQKPSPETLAEFQKMKSRYANAKFIVESNLFIDSKIQIIEQLLTKEIAKVRAKRKHLTSSLEVK